MTDQHDYAGGTRALKILRWMFAPMLRKAVKWLLWLCPDEMIMANVKVDDRGHMSLHKGERLSAYGCVSIHVLDVSGETRAIFMKDGKEI